MNRVELMEFLMRLAQA
jgi:hypothetical protein